MYSSLLFAEDLSRTFLAEGLHFIISKTDYVIHTIQHFLLKVKDFFMILLF